jgi:hypothetical protein
MDVVVFWVFMVGSGEFGCVIQKISFGKPTRTRVLLGFWWALVSFAR